VNILMFNLRLIFRDSTEIGPWMRRHLGTGKEIVYQHEARASVLGELIHLIALRACMGDYFHAPA